MNYKEVLVEKVNIIPKCVGDIAKVRKLENYDNDPNKLYLVIGYQNLDDGSKVVALQDKQFRVFVTDKTNVFIQQDLTIDDMFSVQDSVLS
jgi:hypothetical protein